MEMKPILIGFDGPEPYAIVIVNRVNCRRFKKVCYDAFELQCVAEQYLPAEGYVLDVLMNEVVF
ncbi:hypothetical protein [Kurthia zopfii]|uniref:hypothetical protein n=1 Tax=Kurthia zopfii TaxID=1650 RepID=UPI000F6DBE4D|nr:hypothetical protein [Kurthia zopfii]VEI06631.1 Uncharacterised protein [Kurthia zopfii]